MPPVGPMSKKTFLPATRAFDGAVDGTDGLPVREVEIFGNGGKHAAAFKLAAESAVDDHYFA